MKAAILEGAGKLVVREMPEPKPGPYQALCELLYGATCTGTDTHIIDGTFPWISPFPTVLGHESVGRVVAVGAKVRHFRPGDLVTRVGTPACPEKGISVTWGGFAEFGLAHDHWAMCADGLPESEWKGARVNQHVPYGIDPKTAPMFITWRENQSFLRRLGVAPGAAVLIAGSGGNGLSMAALAALMGAQPVAMLGSAALAETARRAGVTAYADYRDDQAVESLKAACPGGYDLIADAVGKVGLADRLLPLLKAGGAYSTYGMDDKGKIVIDPAKARVEFRLVPPRYDEAEAHFAVSEWVMQGKLDAGLWYDMAKPCELNAIGDAFDAVRRRAAVKALIRLRG